MSTHSIDVIRIKEILRHPDADQLEIIVVGEFSCCIRKGDFKPGDLAAYIPPDYVVDTTRPEFEFLGGKGNVRIKVKRLRGIMSQGLLIHVPETFQEGDNVIDHFGITRYEPEIKLIKTRTNTVKAPKGYYPIYDLENWRKYSNLFKDGELVQITEKIHGSNVRFKWQDDKIHCGSHRQWVGNESQNPWHMAVEQNPWIKLFCENHPNLTVYGEVFGWVQDLQYGARPGQIFFRAFDLYDEIENRWLNWDEIIDYTVFYPDNLVNEGEQLVWVPLLGVCEYSKELINELVDGMSKIPGANHLREGIVVSPVVERNDLKLGRVKLKIVSNDYLSRRDS